MSAAVSSSRTPARLTYACVRCADRKVKCNRERPCSTCVKHNVECVYNASTQPRKRHKRVKVQALADRLKQYEALLQEKGIDLDRLPETPGIQMASRPVPTDITTVLSPVVQLETPESIISEGARSSGKKGYVEK